MNGYNGWKNRATWNVALWINNDYGLYCAAVEFVTKWKIRHNTRTAGLYCAFIKHLGLENDRTPDKFCYMSNNLCYSELSAMLFEIC